MGDATIPTASRHGALWYGVVRAHGCQCLMVLAKKWLSSQETYERICVVCEVKVHSVLGFLDAEHPNRANRMAILDARVS